MDTFLFRLCRNTRSLVPYFKKFANSLSSEIVIIQTSYNILKSLPTIRAIFPSWMCPQPLWWSAAASVCVLLPFGPIFFSKNFQFWVKILHFWQKKKCKIGRLDSFALQTTLTQSLFWLLQHNEISYFPIVTLLTGYNWKYLWLSMHACLHWARLSKCLTNPSSASSGQDDGCPRQRSPTICSSTFSKSIQKSPLKYVYKMSPV